jgi:hypothetical protein
MNIKKPKLIIILSIILSALLFAASCGGNEPAATPAPTATPTVSPTTAPTAAPTAEPTVAPTAAPTAEPTEAPTAAPTAAPTVEPTATPTAAPTTAPTATPTAAPTAAPTATPTAAATAAPTAAPSILYSFLIDPLMQNHPVGFTGFYQSVLASEFLTQAGNPTWSIVENPLGGVALHMTNRTENWHALDIVANRFMWMPALSDYKITIIGKMSEQGTIRIGGADDPWASIFSTETAADGSFELSGVINAETYAMTGSRNWFRIQSECMSDITFYEILIISN